MIRVLVLAAAVALVGAAPAQALPARQLTVMTYNIASAVVTDNDLDPIAGAIELQRAQVVGLQEVDRSWSRSDSLDQAGELALRLGMSFRFDPVLDCSAIDYDRDGECRYGTAVLSRYPLRAGAVRDYRLPQAGDEEPRGMGQVGVNVGGRNLTVLNTHVSDVPAARRAQVRAILRIASQIRGPFVLMGDFNARVSSPEMRLLRTRLRDAALLKRVQRPTVGNTRVDYVYVSRGITVLEARVPTAAAYRLSDHRPLIVRLRIDRT
ncbi:MAG TPA: endonuclease/exonuclease/phosphatase family protein [Solirubrobacteraceae bacterium]|nr:endonuclease/exonuclease/phosphatase family protein [Solirubrobacteraceae bacterium]